MSNPYLLTSRNIRKDPHHREDVIHVTYKKRQNGVVDQMEQERYAMRVDCVSIYLYMCMYVHIIIFIMLIK
jgi:hypothetical protein